VKLEFLKKILIVEFIFLIVLIGCAINVPEVDFITAVCAWIGVIGSTVLIYGWKAKNENRIKIPIKVLESLPADMLDRLDVTTIITTIIQSE
jgi:hypothetical protein